MRMRRQVLLLAALMTAGLAATGCGSDDGGAEAGDCFDGGSVAAFDWGAEVSCRHEHSVEVFTDVTVTGPLAGFTRADLDRAGPARDLYLGAVTQLCEPAWSEYTGYRELGGDGSDAVVLPALYGDMAVEASPAEDWDSGDKYLICYQVFGRPGTDGEEAIPVKGRVLQDLVGREDVPIDVRDCAVGPTAEIGEQKVACREPHDREYLGHLDLAQFLGSVPGLDQGFLDRFDSARSPAADWALLDGVCGRVFPSLIGTQRPDISVLSQVFTADPDWGWADRGTYHLACFAQTTKLTTKSVVGIGDQPL